MKVFPESAMKFGSFEAAKRFLLELKVLMTPPKSQNLYIFSRGFGGVVAQLTVYPIDTLKFRLQCSNLDHPLNAILTAKEMLKDGGVKIFLSRDWCWSCWDVPLCSIGSWNLFHYQKLLVKNMAIKMISCYPRI